MAKSKSFYPCTISQSLFLAWQKFRQRKDGETIADALGYSRPVIDRALNFGYVKTQGLDDKISEFFQNRVNAQTMQADKLNNLVDNSNQIK